MDSLTIIQTSAVPTLTSVKGVSYDELVKRMQEEEAVNSIFPGDQYTFKKGHWVKGYGDKEELADDVFRNNSIIVNAANANFAWRMFVDNGSGKVRPVYLAFANPALGQKLPDRRSLGHNDKELWEVKEFNGQAKQMDPIQKMAVLLFRFDGQKDVHHIVFQSWSGVRVVQDFMKTFGIEGRKHTGMLPVVNLDVRLEKHWEDPSITFDLPVFNVVGWEAPIAEDEPEGAVAVSANADVPTDGGVTSSERTVNKLVEDAMFLAGKEVTELKGVQNGGEPSIWAGAPKETARPLEAVGSGAIGGGLGGRRGAQKSSRRTA